MRWTFALDASFKRPDQASRQAGLRPASTAASVDCTQFQPQNSWQGYDGAYCVDAWTLTSWKGKTNDGGSLTTISSRTYQFDIATHSFLLVSARPP